MKGRQYGANIQKDFDQTINSYIFFSFLPKICRNLMISSIMPLCYATISMADANKEGDVNAADVVEVGKLTGKMSY